MERGYARAPSYERSQALLFKPGTVCNWGAGRKGMARSDALACFCSRSARKQSGTATRSLLHICLLCLFPFTGPLKREVAIGGTTLHVHKHRGDPEFLISFKRVGEQPRTPAALPRKAKQLIKLKGAMLPLMTSTATAAPNPVEWVNTKHEAHIIISDWGQLAWEISYHRPPARPSPC